MNLNIEIPDELGAVVKEQAQAQGISPDVYLTRVLQDALRIVYWDPHTDTLETG